MIHASAVQEINWHMWLYYFSNFNEGMLGVYDLSNPELDLTAEYATRLEYLFYQLYRTMLSWIELGTHLPEKSIHAQPETPDCRRENGNIPKSAAICLVQCFKPFMTSRKLRPQFKKYIAEIVFRHLRGLRGHQAYYHVLSSCLLGRGDFRPNKEYGDEMVVAFAEIDHVIRFDLEEFEAELHAAFP
ncbi:hypothetical protein [Henriciella aquimarina]|uniref:hypothetical protein n=1 Tax=Henriciella aquimarina TaxID=545261 RepID=UPI00117A2496|nr:hypothetical protein [Henriciella aquimarina]